jgi:2-amino-4-hydroxy-6-hydroxymethyldihydropteridine diphosphokinase
VIDVAYIALGSNLGDRAAHLAHARARIAALPGTRVLAASRVEATAAIGPVAQGDFLNQMLRVETSLAPRALLDALHAIEREAGRTRDVRWGPRTLDLDIVLLERQAADEPGLRVPHPELRNRDFWLRELDELGAPLPGEHS